MSAALSEPAPAPALPTFADVEAAARRIAGIAHRTPVMTSRIADGMTGAQLFFKCENLQRSGAFKFRGAYNAISALPEEHKARGVVAFSSGNHAQAIAYAGSLLGVKTVIIMPSDAPVLKLEATRGYGGEVVTYDRYKDDREAIGRQLAAERGLTMIPPYDHADVIAGQGTAALELIEETGPLDALFVCLGGGGLLSGSALTAAARSPGCQVYGVEPEAGNDGQRSFRSGQIVRIPVPVSIADGALTTHLGGGGLLSGSALTAAARSPGCQVYGVEPEAGNDGQRSFRSGQIVRIPVPVSIADGALTTHLGERTFPIIRERVTDILTVSDAALVETMRFLLERLKIVAEPTGCLAAAAAMSGLVPIAGKRVGIILSGGNVDSRVMARLLA